MEHLLRNFRQSFLTRSGHVTDLRRHKWCNLRPIFQENRVFSHVTCCHWKEGRYLSMIQVRGWSHLTFGTESWLFKVIRGQWSWLTLLYSDYFGVFCVFFFGVSKPNTWPLSHIDMFIVPLHTVRCHSGMLTQFALRRFGRWKWRCSLPGRFA